MRPAAALRPPLVALLVACTAACAADDRVGGTERVEPGGWRTVERRAGDTVVVRTVGAPDSATLRLVEELRIGEIEGAEDYTFGNVLAIAPTRDGGAYVWDGRMTLLRRYDATGRYVRQIGRRGEGPGEYEQVSGMTMVGDLLLFWDRYNHHLSVYDTTGTLLRWWKPAGMSGVSGVLHPTTGDRVYLQQIVGPVGPDGVPPLGYVSYDLQGRPGPDTLRRAIRFDGRTPPFLDAAGPRGGRVVELPYAAAPFGGISPLGHLVHGWGDQYALLDQRHDAPPLRIERDAPVVPVSDAERADEESRIAAELRRYDPGWEWASARIPATKPFVNRLLFGAEGRLWVERPGPSRRVPDDELPPEPDYQNVLGPLPPYRWRQSMRYDVFEPDGRFLGTVERPEGAELLHMRGDAVWGVVRDSLDVPYVVRWRVEPSVRR